MAAWSVYADSGREIRRYKSKAAAIHAVTNPRDLVSYGYRARKTFNRNRTERVIYPRQPGEPSVVPPRA